MKPLLNQKQITILIMDIMKSQSSLKEEEVILDEDLNTQFENNNSTQNLETNYRDDDTIMLDTENPIVIEKDNWKTSCYSASLNGLYKNLSTIKNFFGLQTNN